MTIEYAGMGFVVAMSFIILILLVVIIWQGSKVARTKMQIDAQLDQDNIYRKMAQESAVFQKQIAEDISDLRDRVAAIEKMLREVE